MAIKKKTEKKAKSGQKGRGKKPMVMISKRGKALPAVKKRSAASKRPKQMNLSDKIRAMEEKILNEKKELTELRKKVAPEPVPEYIFKTHDGSEIKLSELFGNHRDLILVHNMGKRCPYCTLWADGFTGVTQHLENRAGFVVISKDDVETQRDFYQSRGWNFKMYSSHGSTFNRDMKFETEEGSQLPGVSAFFKDDDGRIFRAGYTNFGPGDDFCGLWHMLDLLKDGADGWEPQFEY